MTHDHLDRHAGALDQRLSGLDRVIDHDPRGDLGGGHALLRGGYRRGPAPPRLPRTDNRCACYAGCTLPAIRLEERPERGANPPPFEPRAARLTGKVCSGAGGGRRGAGRRAPARRDGSLREAWTGRGRSPRQRQTLECSLPLGDCQESRAGALLTACFRRRRGGRPVGRRLQRDSRSRKNRWPTSASQVEARA